MLRFLTATPRPLVACILLALQGSTYGQLDAHTASAAEPARAIVVGRVLGPDEAPAVGAVVVTSAGGQAVTDSEGAFSLELELSADAGSLRVTAVMGSGAGSLVGSAPVVGLMRGATTSAGTLLLEQASDCEPSWLPTFGPVPGVGSGGVTPGVSALAVFDDGGGPALYVGGGFATAGGLPVGHVAKWDGSLWSGLGGGVNNEVYALTVFDDGSGPALFAGGAFTNAGGVAASRIAKWNGSSWSALGSGVNHVVQALVVHDEGSGAQLYAGGDFTTAGGVMANRVAKWNGSSWSPVGLGVNGRVLALALFDDGDGLVLFAGGVFTRADGLPAGRIARWSGTGWASVGGGMTDGDVRALAVFDDGRGPALYAGGAFQTAGGVPASRIARWDGASWSSLQSGMNDAVEGLAVFDDGSGPALYAGGRFTVAAGGTANYLARWDGTDWSTLGSGMNSNVRVLAALDVGSGPALYAGGAFSAAFSMSVGLALNHVARWTGASWAPLGSGMNGTVRALAAFDDGDGPALYAGGSFTSQGDTAARRIAKWDGTSWSALGSGMSGAHQDVYALAVFDDGSGPALFAGGGFTSAGGVEAEHIAKWDGTSWSALGSGVGETGGVFPAVYSLAVFDDGSGPALYAGGAFTLAGGVPANRVAKWDGSIWTALGSGVDGTSIPYVEALAVFDDGSGPALHAAGFFKTAGGVPANSIAKWDGAGWAALGGGLTGSFEGVSALQVHDDGSGPALYAAGAFALAGGVAAAQVARWDGSSWSSLGSGLSSIGGVGDPIARSLAVFDDGGGPALYAGGSFTLAGSVPVNRIAKWDGSSWSAVGGGMNDEVRALAVHDAGSGPALFAGGSFSFALDSLDSFVARWGGCPVTPSPWTDLGFALSGVAGEPLLVGTGGLTPGSAGTLGLSQAAPSTLALLFVSLAGTPTPFKCGTLVPVPVALQVPLITNGGGGIPLGWASWPATLSDLELHFQYAIKDPAAICGVSLSNALRADVP